MFSPIDPNSAPVTSSDALDRTVFFYLCLPLVIFLVGWFKWWAAVPLVACTTYGLRALLAKGPFVAPQYPVTLLQLGVAVIVGCGWSVLGGIDHLVFTNSDWHIRDAVLHDLVASRWPVGYGLINGEESLLRAPVAFYLPAALVGKAAGLAASSISHPLPSPHRGGRRGNHRDV